MDKYLKLEGSVKILNIIKRYKFFIICFISIMSLAYMIKENSQYEDPEVWIEQVPVKNENIEEIENIKIKSQRDVYRILHQMANTKIVPIDGIIDGKIEITEESISKFKEEYKNYCEKNGEVYSSLPQILNKWEQGDFSECVTIHNNAHDYLEIQEGKAIRLDLDNEY